MGKSLGMESNFEEVCFEPDPDNVRDGEITRNLKTQSSLPLSTSETGSWPGFSRSFEYSSFEKKTAISAVFFQDSVTSKT